MFRLYLILATARKLVLKSDCYGHVLTYLNGQLENGNYDLIDWHGSVMANMTVEQGFITSYHRT